jgi:hypothetical protein
MLPLQKVLFSSGVCIEERNAIFLGERAEDEKTTSFLFGFDDKLLELARDL